MRKYKPKGKTPSLIGGSLGKPRKCIVQRTSDCKRCKASIQKGAECYEIAQLGGSFSSYKRYCNDCFSAIVYETRTVLDDLIKDIENIYARNNA